MFQFSKVMKIASGQKIKVHGPILPRFERPAIETLTTIVKNDIPQITNLSSSVKIGVAESRKSAAVRIKRLR